MQNNCQVDHLLRVNIEQSAALPVAQEPSAPPQEIGDESEDEWKFMQLKEGQGEKQIINTEITVEKEEVQDIKENIPPVEQERDQSISPNPLDLLNRSFQEKTVEIEGNLKQESIIENVEQTENALNISKSSTQEQIGTEEDDDMNYQLNPEAKEFVPTFPPPPAQSEISNGFASGEPAVLRIATPLHVTDEVVAQSPRKGANINMEDIQVPSENEFDKEIAERPHELLQTECNIETNEDVPYQEMSLKEAMHGLEKEDDQIAKSPEEVRSGFNPVAELENADMKESIYVENSSSNYNSTAEEDVLNQVQTIPSDNEEIIKDTSFEFLNKEEISSGQEEKDIVSPMSQLSTNDEAIFLPTAQAQNEINIPKSPIPDKEEAAPVDSKSKIQEEICDMAKNIASETTTKVKAAKSKETDSLKTAAPKTKVPDTKKTSATKAAPAAPKKSGSSTSADLSKPKTTVAAATTKPKVAVSSMTTAAARPRTAPTSTKTLTEKKSTTSTVKSRIDSKPPASSLAARKPTTITYTKPKIEPKTLMVKPPVSKTGLTAKPPVTSRVSSAPSATNGITKTVSQKLTLSTKTVPAKTSLTSPRGTLTSTLRKTEALKSPAKSSVTTTTTTTSRVGGGTKTTTSTKTTTTAKTSSGIAKTNIIVRKTASTGPAAAANSGTTKPSLVQKKPTPIKKPTGVSPAAADKKIIDKSVKSPTAIKVNNISASSVTAADNTLSPNASSTPVEANESKLNGSASPSAPDNMMEFA